MAMTKVYGIVRLIKADGTVEEHKNSIVNLSLLLNQLVNLTTTPSSIVLPYIVAGGSTLSATFSVQLSPSGWQFKYVAKPTLPLSFTVANLYPAPLSLLSDTPLATLSLTSEASDITQICWSIYIEDQTGILYNSIPSSVIPSAPFSLQMYADDGYAVSLLSLYNVGRYVYNFFVDNTVGNKINYVNVSWFTFIYYTTPPTLVQTPKVKGIQVTPALASQLSVFYYVSVPIPLSNNQGNLIASVKFTYTSSSTYPADGLVVCFYASSPPAYFNTASVSGMANSNVATGNGQQVCVEFDPYYDPPLSITYWENGTYKYTALSAGSSSSHISLTPCHVYNLTIICYLCQGVPTLLILVIDCTAGTGVYNTTVVLVNLPTPPYKQQGYIIVTFRTGGCYANWTLVEMSSWYPYFIQLSADYTSPQIMPITAVFSSD